MWVINKHIHTRNCRIEKAWAAHELGISWSTTNGRSLEIDCNVFNTMHMNDGPPGPALALLSTTHPTATTCLRWGNVFCRPEIGNFYSSSTKPLLQLQKRVLTQPVRWVIRHMHFCREEFLLGIYKLEYFHSQRTCSSVFCSPCTHITLAQYAVEFLRWPGTRRPNTCSYPVWMLAARRGSS
jgi:hypothetical protein